ncbi:MAG: nickel-dependent lactate racemase [Chloroflexi bacterium]|nr:nickel-dependent lactate racemase [Chloroflexota bacterium]
MEIHLPYGRGSLPVRLPNNLDVQVLEPPPAPGLPDEPAALRHALQHPVGVPPMPAIVRPHDTVVIVFSDRTRPMPNERVLPALLRELAHVPDGQIVLLNALGLHRSSPPEELREMLGEEIVSRYRILQHDPHDSAAVQPLGQTRFGHPIAVNRAYVTATRRILTGFIEPHFFAGFSGGPKSVLPGIAGAGLILANHNAQMLAHPQAAWGVTQGNPVWQEMAEVCSRVPPDFLCNVTLNAQRQITGVFAGQWETAHRRGVEWARQHTTIPVDQPFDLVVTTNSGFPLDINLYQAVKGMSAAARVVKPGGAIVMAAQCADGLPDHGGFRALLGLGRTPAEWLQALAAPGFSAVDQWEVQLLAQVLGKAEVWLKAEGLPDDDYALAGVQRCDSVEETVVALAQRYGPGARIAVLPQGPQAIPTLVG